MTNEEAIRIIKIVLAIAEDFEITVQGEEFTEEKCKEAVEIVTKALEQEPCEDIKEIREVMSCDADEETKCKMISNILTAKPHYFKEQEPCEDAISRQMALDLCERFNGCVPYSVLSSRDMLPSVSTEKTGRWIVKKSPDGSHCDLYVCQCGMEQAEYTRFYPNCGAKMEQPYKGESGDAE